MARLILGGVAAVLIALLAGYLWGAAGKSPLEDALREAELRGDLLGAQSAVLAARVDVYETNFGNSSRNLEEARALVERAMQRLQAEGRDTKGLDAALAPIREAQQLAGKLDLAANSRAAEAGKMIETMLQNMPRP